MRNILVNVIVIGLLIVAYYSNLFSILAAKGTFIAALILLLIILIAAFKILGNPFRKVDDDDDDIE